MKKKKKNKPIDRFVVFKPQKKKKKRNPASIDKNVCKIVFAHFIDSDVQSFNTCPDVN